MAIYNTLKKGDNGYDVRELQTGLNKAGYDLKVDGKFGALTEAALKDYQSKNVDANGVQLKSDGVFGKLTGGAMGLWDPTGGMTKLQKANYQSKELLDQYLNRDKFSYDYNADPIYQQYKQQYIQQGKSAADDAISRASALSGGYGNSYGVTAASQANQEYLSKLNNIIPDLYAQALNKYQAEGTELANKLNAANAERDYQYNLWLQQQQSSGGSGGGRSGRSSSKSKSKSTTKPTGTTTPRALEAKEASNVADTLINKGFTPAEAWDKVKSKYGAGTMFDAQAYGAILGPNSAYSMSKVKPGSKTLTRKVRTGDGSRKNGHVSPAKKK